MEWKRLGDVCEIKRGSFSPRPRNNPRYYGGDIPFVQTGDISGAKTYIQKYSQTLNAEGLSVSKLFFKDTILMTIAANVGDVAILNFDSACPDSVVAFIPAEGVNNKWLFYALKKMKINFESLSTGSAQRNLSLKKINPVKIPVPPIEEQARIVAILDKFDALVNDISSGLPREIELREKQYEYYRDKLLSFDKRC